MTKDARNLAPSEWGRHWPLVLAACFGYSAIGMQVYALGPFVTRLEHAFGWSRAEVMTGLTVSSTLGVLLNFAVGMLVDRIGPRRVGIAGLVVVTGAFALLGTATGTFANWIALWLLVAVGILLAQSTVWTTAVAGEFGRSRGLALSVVLSGSSLAGAVLPILATWLIEQMGWRLAFAGVGAVWAAVCLPLAFLFVRDPASGAAIRAGGGPIDPPGLSLGEGLRRRAFWQLFVAAFVFAFYTIAISANLVPLFTEKGVGPVHAAGLAGVVGLVGIGARIAAGYMIDRLPAQLLGAVLYLLPVSGCALLLAGTPTFAALTFAVIAFGVTIGAEFDVTFYLAARHFGLRSYGSLIGALLTAGSLGGVVGPVLSGWVHDRTGSYDALLVALMALLALAALSLATIGNPRQGQEPVREKPAY
jgi:nitrate/nitrite transporter NarK